MNNKFSKSLILKEIKSHYGIKKDTEFAEFLGIKQSALSNWYNRDTFDLETLITKCVDIEPYWMVTGEGGMLKAKEKPTPAKDEKDSLQILKLSMSLIEQRNKMLEERISELKDYNQILVKNNETLNAVVLNKIGEK